MKTREIKNVNYIGWVVIILAIVVLYFVYFFFYIPQQESLLQRRGFRILKEYGSNMHDKYAYYQKHLENYGDYYVIRSILESDSIKLKVEGFKRNKANQEHQKEILEIFEMMESLDPDILTDSIEKTQPNEKDGKLYFDFLHNESFNSISKEITDRLDQLFGVNRASIRKMNVYKVPVDKLMEGLKFDRLLDNVVMFDSSGVIYNSNLDKVHDITNPQALIDSTQKHQGGITESIKVRGEKKQIMILPINFKGLQYYLTGIISDKDFKKKTRTINNQLLILISGILLLLLTSMPVLKIVLINRQERLKSADAYGATVSVILSTGLLVLIAISVSNHGISEKIEEEKRIKQLSEILYNNVNSDIQSIIELHDSIISENNRDTTSLAGFASNSFQSDKRFKQIPPRFLGTPVPINEIILIDSTGLVTKAVTRTPFSEAAKVDLSERLYFKNVMDPNESWLRKNDRQQFYIESIKSYNTGYQETAISFHLSSSDAKRFNASVLAITSAIPSLYKQVLPKDVEFVVINENGKVLYHSVKSKNLHENFLDECEHDSRLLSAIKLWVDEDMTINYNEKERLARIVPIKDAPLYHITLINHQQTDNRNARIFLFTFYFLMATLACIGIGILIMRWAQPAPDFMEVRSWALNWLLFQPKNYLKYKALIIIFGLILIFEMLGVFMIEKPVAMFIYQLVFITYTGFASYAILGEEEEQNENLQKNSLVSEILIIGIILLLIVLLIWMRTPWLLIMFLLAAVVFLTWMVHFVSGGRFRKLPNTRDDFNKFSFVPFRFSEIRMLKSLTKPTEYKPVPKAVRKAYHSFMLIWLACLSAVPVIQYYHTVQIQEELISKRNQMEHIAVQNLELAREFKDFKESGWFNRIQGNGLDSLVVSYNIANENHDGHYELDDVDKLYSKLPDPLVTGDNLMAYLKNESYHHDWKINGPELHYSVAGLDGLIGVRSPDYSRMGIFSWLLFLAVPMLLVTMLIWKLYQYMADNILNTNPAIRIIPETHSLKILLQNEQLNRIILNSFDGEHCLQASKQLIKNNQEQTLEAINAEKLLSEGFNLEPLLSGKNKIIWISDLDLCIPQIRKHDLVLNRLMALSQNAEGKIIIALPFETEFIHETYNNFLAENELEKEEKAQIYILQMRWKVIFKSFHKYSGYFVTEKMKDVPVSTIEKKQLKEMDEGKAELPDSFSNSLFNQSVTEKMLMTKNREYRTLEERMLGIEYEMEPRYLQIWNNLCAIEKLILFDVADDGILNLKNKVLIKRLVIKGLIIPEPYPKLYADSFKYFVNNSINPDDAKILERKLNTKGSWHNLRYLILLILILLSAFVFISQGISIEKVIGIFAGILALFSGMMRLFDSNIFKQSAK